MLEWIAYLPLFIMSVIWIWLFGFSRQKEKDSKEEEFKKYFIGKMVDYIPDYINGMPGPKKQTYIIYDVVLCKATKNTNPYYVASLFNIKTNEKEDWRFSWFELEALRLGANTNFKIC